MMLIENRRNTTPIKNNESQNSNSCTVATDKIMPFPISLTYLAQELKISSIAAKYLAGDGSDRMYFRLTSPELNESLVFMLLSAEDSSKLKENKYEWTSIYQTLTDNKILVPKLIKSLPQCSGIVIEDYGDIMLESIIADFFNKNEFNKIIGNYSKSSDIIGKMLNISQQGNAPWFKRRFDTEKFVWEMNFFKKHFLSQSLSLGKNEISEFERDSIKLSNYLSQTSKWFVHRDYHSRNIMYKNGLLAVIDFQDARIGPASYDLVSLVFDSYVPLTQEHRLEIFNICLDQLRSSCGIEIAEEISIQWRAVLLQRQLKAIGSFGYLTNEKKRGNYLKYVKPAIETLSNSIVYDERWPFISSGLIDAIGMQYV